MNKFDLIRERNKNAQKVRMSNRVRNVLRWNSGETDIHINQKLNICKYIKSIGEEFICEAIFENNSGRCDVLWLDRGLAIEVIESEKEYSILKKVASYPFPLIVVKADQVFNEKLIL